MNAERLLERFLRYVAIHTTANDATEDYPSSTGQLELGKILADELLAIGCVDAEQDEHGLVLATVPATTENPAPTIAFNAHLDTSPETKGEGVRPQVLRDYAGGDIVLPNDPQQVIRISDNPQLDQLHGCTFITTDGTTLLGGDDKAGVAIIMETAAYLLEHLEIPHGPLRILFTCDEEIGRGMDHVDIEKLAATACYTLDGGGANEIDVETFSADLATVTIQGINIHPSIAKDRMVNAVRAAGDFAARLPRTKNSPETTSGREGFLHPYQIEGGVAEVLLKVLLRDFDSENLWQQANLLRETAQAVQQDHPLVKIKVDVKQQYRNLADGLASNPRVVAYVEEAHRRLGRQAKRTIIRGGTDGSQFTERGLPTPNLSSGQHNPHSPLEWVCLDEMVQAAEVMVELVKVWAESPPLPAAN